MRLFYSVNTKLAYEINEKYYKGKHYVWCCPFFFKVNHPASSTPKHIYKELVRDVDTEDEHSAKIRQNIAGLITGAQFKFKEGVINQAQFDEIEFRVMKKWKFSDFKPYVYIIPCTTNVKKNANPVLVVDKASPDASEFIITALAKEQFDTLNFD